MLLHGRIMYTQAPFFVHLVKALLSTAYQYLIQGSLGMKFIIIHLEVLTDRAIIQERDLSAFTGKDKSSVFLTDVKILTTLANKGTRKSIIVGKSQMKARNKSDRDWNLGVLQILVKALLRYTHNTVPLDSFL